MTGKMSMKMSMSMKSGGSERPLKNNFDPYFKRKKIINP